jgi:hypothetical protein
MSFFFGNREALEAELKSLNSDGIEDLGLRALGRRNALAQSSPFILLSIMILDHWVILTSEKQDRILQKESDYQTGKLLKYTNRTPLEFCSYSSVGKFAPIYTDLLLFPANTVSLFSESVFYEYPQAEAKHHRFSDMYGR